MQIPEYIEVRNATGQPVAFLSPEADGLKDAIIDLKMNADHTLEFQLPLTSTKWSALTAECRIIAGGREFVILKPDAVDVIRDGGKVWGKVMAEESYILLDKVYATISNDPQNPTPPELSVTILSGGSDLSGGRYQPGSAAHALYALLQGTGWELDVCDVEGIHDLETEKKSVLQNIEEIQSIWGGLLVWDSINHKLSLRDENKWQPESGFQVRYARNEKNITKTVNNDIVTRLYVFGKDDLDIGSVNNGVKYLENFSFTDNIYVGIYESKDQDDPQKLKEEGEQVLAKICKPRNTYKVGMCDLRTLPDYAKGEDFDLGWMAKIIDPEVVGVGYVRARIMRYKYYIFEPWKCELEIGEPEESLAAQIAQAIRTSKFVTDTLQGKAFSNLAKGFIDTFTTRINSANGKLVWNDEALEAIEIDETGQETGYRIRITPGGIGISTDGGQTYATAITGAGILANAIIVNELYALSTADGYTKLTGAGLEVWDNQPTPVKRMHAGQYFPGKFGLQLKDKTGNITILDEDGILQTWQEGRADNIDANCPLILNIYLPPETKSIIKALLRFKLLAFRAYEIGAASESERTLTSSSGGSSTVTSSSGGGTVTTSDAPYYHLSVWLPGDWMDLAGQHNHGIPSYTRLATSDGSYVTFVESGSHAHGRDVGHDHDVDIPSHTHKVYIPSHSHTVNIPSHTHDIIYGIYLGPKTSGITIKINGTDRTAALGGPFNSDQNALDISPYLTAGQWNTIEIGGSGLGRIDASVFIQAKMGV